MKYLLLTAFVLCLSATGSYAQTRPEPITTDCTLADIQKDLKGTWDMNYKGVNGIMTIIVGPDNNSFSGAFVYPDRKGGSVKGALNGSIETGKDSKGNCCYMLHISWADSGLEPPKDGKLMQVRGSRTMSGSIGTTSLMANKKL
jgi:hypothetical protein